MILLKEGQIFRGNQNISDLAGQKLSIQSLKSEVRDNHMHDIEKTFQFYEFLHKQEVLKL